MEPKSVTKNMRVFRNLALGLVVTFSVTMFFIIEAISIYRRSGLVLSWQAFLGVAGGLVVLSITVNILQWNPGLEKANQDFHSIFRIEPDDDRELAQKYVNAILEQMRQEAKAAFGLLRKAWYHYAAGKTKMLEDALSKRAEEFRQKEDEFWRAVHVADDHNFIVPDSIDEPIKQLDVYG